jgi:hypothetical protein
VVVGHNVSYDRLRLADEYALAGTGTRFLDTMSLHVAIGGISSHQRPAWMRHWKGKRARAGERLRQAEEVVLEAELATLTERAAHAKDDAERTAIDARRDELRKRLIEHAHQDALNAETEIDVDTETDSGAAAASRWEELSSGNSLADVAFLHCGIELDKEIRNDFMTCSRAHIAAGAQEYLSYCASDVAVTHAVYAQVLPAFRAACPSPVSFAGALAMGSAFLPVSGEWERYIERAESTYQALELKIRTRLVELAVQARDLMDGEKWRGDPWLEQLDWTPKLAGPSRGVEVAVSASTTNCVREAQCTYRPHRRPMCTPGWPTRLTRPRYQLGTTTSAFPRHRPKCSTTSFRFCSRYPTTRILFTTRKRMAGTTSWTARSNAGKPPARLMCSTSRRRSTSRLAACPRRTRSLRLRYVPETSRTRTWLVCTL